MTKFTDFAGKTTNKDKKRGLLVEVVAVFSFRTQNSEAKNEHPT